MAVHIPPDYPERIKRLRQELGLTQVRLAELLGVSFASVNRWENAQSRPNRLAWRQIQRAEREGLNAFGGALYSSARAKQSATADWLAEAAPDYETCPEAEPSLDFSTPAEVVRLVVHAERLGYGHLANPAFGTETSLIDPLPHQFIAVYEHMLPQPRLRFLLADDAGAGKTIMAGLYVREMLTRRLIRRVLILPPAGLVGNWQHEMWTLFGLSFRVITGAEARAGNPFAGPDGNLVIVSVDTACAERTFSRLREAGTEPYDLVIFDEAHKLAADRNPDLTVRKTDRYRLAEALAGAPTDPGWELPWHCHHLLLLTATPHMGKEFPYYSLWRLLEPEILTTLDAWNAYPPEARARHFIRRTKEEMVRFDGTPIYPSRESNTISYDLSPAEQLLYDETTSYIRVYYNRARILNRSAARLAMSIFQRRLASSTYALYQSFLRRLEKLTGLIEDIRSGRLTEEQLVAAQRRLDATPDVLDTLTGDEEEAEGGREQNERVEEQAMGGVVATSLAELLVERGEVERLAELARQVLAAGEEAKFAKLRELMRDPRFGEEKILIFTEHRDTLEFLVQRLEGLGFAGQVAQIHGGMPYQERMAQVEFFKRPVEAGGARYLVATDAAGEGINLQFCWLMVNYDIPWNPARLEQRMGRIHRYKQQHDPVLLINLVAGKTREGRVLKTLLDKLEHIRKELGSDKVFDIIGRQFEGISLKDLILEAVAGEDEAAEAVRQIEARLTPEQVRAQLAERAKLSAGGDVARQLPRQRAELTRLELRRLLPGYVRLFIEEAAPLLDLGIEGDLEGFFTLRPLRPGAMDPLWPVLESYEPERQVRFTVYKPAEGEQAIFLHPGEPLFDRLRALVLGRFGKEALRGGVFVDPYAERPYFFHLALVRVRRQADPELREAFGRDALLDVRLVGLRQEESGELTECPVEYLLLLRGASSVPAVYAGFAGTASAACERARAFAREIARSLAQERVRGLASTLAEREEFIARGYAYQDAELAIQRSRLAGRLKEGDARAAAELTRVKARQRELAVRRERSLAVLRREPELILPDEPVFLAHALVVPSDDPVDRKRQDREVEKIAVRVAWGYEESCGFTVQDVSSAELALAAGLEARPGFDLLSRNAAGVERAIEVKGRARIGTVELTANEWVKACNLRERYWLYVVFDCATSHPRLLRIQDPFGKLLAKNKGGVVIEESAIFAAAEADG